MNVLVSLEAFVSFLLWEREMGTVSVYELSPWVSDLIIQQCGVWCRCGLLYFYG